MQEITRLANSGDKAALLELRAILNANPEIWQQVGDMGEYALQSLVRLIGNGDKLREESTIRKAKQLADELLGPSPSEAEVLAAKRAVLCWLESMYLDTLDPIPQGATLQHTKVRLQVKSSAQRRFDQSLKTLVTIRKLLPGAGAAGSPAVSKSSTNGRHHGNDRANGKPRKKRRSAKTDKRPVNRIVPFLPEPAGTT